MIVRIRQNISNLLDDKRQLISTTTSEMYVLNADIDKKIKNIITGQIYDNFVYVYDKNNIKNFIEINK